MDFFQSRARLFVFHFMLMPLWKGVDPSLFPAIYIYIVIHRQTLSLYHNSSVWLDT